MSSQTFSCIKVMTTFRASFSRPVMLLVVSEALYNIPMLSIGHPTDFRGCLPPIDTVSCRCPHGSSTNVAAPTPQFLCPRHVPDVPEDVNFLIEHLNDPNFDLRSQNEADGDSYDLDHKESFREKAPIMTQNLK